MARRVAVENHGPGQACDVAGVGIHFDRKRGDGPSETHRPDACFVDCFQ